MVFYPCWARIKWSFIKSHRDLQSIHTLILPLGIQPPKHFGSRWSHLVPKAFRSRKAARSYSQWMQTKRSAGKYAKKWSLSSFLKPTTECPGGGEWVRAWKDASFHVDYRGCSTGHLPLASKWVRSLHHNPKHLQQENSFFPKSIPVLSFLPKTKPKKELFCLRDTVLELGYF